MRHLKNHPTFTPQDIQARTALLEDVRRRLRLRSDRQLGEQLGFTSSVICRIKSGRLGFTDELILAVHETTGMPIAEIKQAISGETA